MAINSKIKDELMKALNMKSVDKESAARFIGRLAVAFNKADGKAVDGLSPAAAKVLSDELKLGDEEDEKKAAKTNGKDKPKQGAAPSGKKQAEKKPAKAKKEKAERGPSVMTLIKKEAYRHPKDSIDELCARLKAKGVESSRASVQTIRAGFNHSIEVLRELGQLAKE